MRLLPPEEIAALKLSQPVALSLHPAAVYLGSLSQGSQRTMRSSLNAIARLLSDGECDCFTLDWSKLRYRHTAAVRNALFHRLSATTVNKMLVALRRVLKEAHRLDLIETSDYNKAIDLANIKAPRKLRGRALSEDEIDALLSNCMAQKTPQDLRDAAAIAILRIGGIRRQELALLNLADLDKSDGSLAIRRGKGGFRRTVYLTLEALQFVEDWLSVRGSCPGALICPVNKGGKVELRHFAADGDGIYKLVLKRAERAGVQKFSPHDFRRTFCSQLFDSDTDTFTVQQLAGHASATTTAMYDRRGDTTKRLAVQQLKLRKS